MAAFNFNFFGYDYEHGIMILSDSLLAATEALQAKSDATAAEWKKYEAEVAEGLIKPIEERDDETGELIWHQGQFYAHDLELIDEGVQALRKAHVTALYHHWERVIGRWTNAPPKSEHKKLVALLEAKGIKPPTRFNDVYNLNNVLKHDSDKGGPDLLRGWPEIFRNARRLEARQQDGDKRIPWSDSIVITKERMDEVFSAMRGSGPTAR